MFFVNELTSEVVGKPVNATVWVAPEKKLTGIRLYYVLPFYLLLYHFSVRFQSADSMEQR